MAGIIEQVGVTQSTGAGASVRLPEYQMEQFLFGICISGNFVYIGNTQEALMSAFSWRCQYCSCAFQMSSDAVASALAAADATQARHHVEHCPRCRKALKIPVDQLRHHAPLSAPATFSTPIHSQSFQEDKKPMTDIPAPFPPVEPAAPEPEAPKPAVPQPAYPQPVTPQPEAPKPAPIAMPMPIIELPAPAPVSPKPVVKKVVKKPKKVTKKPVKKVKKAAKKPVKKVKKAAKKPVKKAAKKPVKKAIKKPVKKAAKKPVKKAKKVIKKSTKKKSRK
jgi:hypothetical protein